MYLFVVYLYNNIMLIKCNNISAVVSISINIYLPLYVYLLVSNR